MAFCGAWANKKGDLRMESAASKILGSEWYWETVNDLFQVRGGRGFMTAESQRRSGEIGIPVMQMMRDARINLVWEGTSEILRIWMAREGLASYIEQGLLLLKGTSAQRLEALLYYARMAVRSCLPFSIPTPAAGMFGRDSGQWVRVVESSSRRLTRTILGTAIRHQQSLHHKQLLLQDIVDDSLALFPMAAMIWYTAQPDIRDKPGIQALTDYFCQDMADRLNPKVNRISRHKKDADVYRLSKAIMNGEYIWLEEGIVPLLGQQPGRPVA